jgi:DNA-binding transcriptional LysR family regulator
MNLQRVRYFIAVAEELHFGRAAERLHMAQPPLSQQIRLLETELGVRLFDRTTRRVALTPAGEVFLVEALRLAAAADSAERVMDEFRTGDGGLLRLGFVDSAAFEVMPRYLRAYRQRWPKVQHDLQIMSSRKQADALRSGVIDVGISRTPGVGDDVVSTEFRVERLFLAVGPDHPEITETEVPVSAIGHLSFIGFDRRLSPTLHEQLRQLFEAAGQLYEPEIEATEYTTILGLVASGEGVAIVPDGVRTFCPQDVRYVQLIDDDAHMSMFLNHRPDEHLRVVAQARELILQLFADA